MRHLRYNVWQWDIYNTMCDNETFNNTMCDTMRHLTIQCVTMRHLKYNERQWDI